jgi:hypothetical protein
VGITSIQSPKATSSTNTRGAGCSATARTLIQLARRSTHPMACAERRSEANTLVERGHTDSQFVTSATTNAAAGQFAKLLSSPTRLRLSYGSFASSQGGGEQAAIARSLNKDGIRPRKAGRRVASRSFSAIETTSARSGGEIIGSRTASSRGSSLSRFGTLWRHALRPGASRRAVERQLNPSCSAAQCFSAGVAAHRCAPVPSRRRAANTTSTTRASDEKAGGRTASDASFHGHTSIHRSSPGSKKSGWTSKQ